MKKLKDIFELVFLSILLIIAFQGFKEKRPATKRRKFAKVLILTGILWLGYVVYDITHPFADCAPATMSRIFPEYNVKEMRAICKTERSGTTIQDLFDGWEKVSTNKLKVAYSHEEIVEGKSKQLKFGLNKTYLWLGILQRSGHCALVKFTPESVEISNSEFMEGTTNYFIVNMPYDEFFEKTYFVCEAPEMEKVRFR